MSGRRSAVRTPALASLLVLPLLLAGCASDPGTGRFALAVTDLPGNIADFSHLNVTVDKITLTGKDNKTVDVEPATATFDLRTLVLGNTTTLFNGSIAAGEYARVDIHVSNATGLLASDGSSVDVKAPSGRIFLNTAFTIVEGGETNFLFDVQVVRTGNGEYQLKPNADGSGPGKVPSTADDARKADRKPTTTTTTTA